MAIQSYRDYVAWQRAMALCEMVYTASKLFPTDERFGLTNQVRRAAVSVPSNIAEGQGRGNDKEFNHFLRIAHGSLRELETQILIAQRIGYSSTERVETILEASSEVGRLINGLRKKL